MKTLADSFNAPGSFNAAQIQHAAAEATASSQHNLSSANLDFAVLPNDRWPGRLVVGGKTLHDFVAIGEEVHNDATWTVRVFQSLSVPTLQIRAQWRVVGAATEWISTLVNDSTEPSERVTELRALGTGFMAYRPLPENEQDPEYADALAAVAENKRLRPLIVSSERVGLIRPNLRFESVTAFQHHRHSDSRGIIVALRGTWPWGETVTLRPEHIEADATYQVTRWDDYRAAPPAKVGGAELKEVVITLPKTRSSVLLEYQRIG